MVGIQGLGGVPEPKSDRPERAKNDRGAAPQSAAAGSGAGQSKDGVVISPEAKAASEVTRLVDLASTQSDIRADKVAEAKEKIARGDFRDPAIVAQVAQRLLKFLP